MSVVEDDGLITAIAGFASTSKHADTTAATTVANTLKLLALAIFTPLSQVVE
jgi:hypothetical protein